MSLLSQVITQASALLSLANTDILLILFALLIHTVFFGRYRVSLGKDWGLKGPKSQVALAPQSSRDLERALATARAIEEASSPADALRLFQEAVSCRLLSKEVLVAAASAALAQGHAALARAVVKELPAKPEKEVVAAALRLCAPGGPLAGRDPHAELLQLYARFGQADLSEEVDVQCSVVIAALRSGKANTFRQTLAAVVGCSQQEAFFRTFAAEQELLDSQAVFGALSGRTAAIYNAILGACLKVDDLASAEAIMQEAAKAKLADGTTCRLIVKAYLKKGDLRQARSTMEALSAQGVRPTGQVFNEFLEVVGRERGDSGVWALVADRQSLGVTPNNGTCTMLLKIAQQSSKVVDMERALMCVDELEETLSEANLGLICDACVQAGCRELLIRQLSKHWGANKVPAKSTYTYSRLIRAYGAIHHMKGAWATWQEMQARGISRSSVVLGCMVEAMVANGDPEAGYQLIREHEVDPELRPLVNAVMYCSVLKGFSHQKKFDRVWVLYEEMRAQRLRFSAVTYNALIDASSRSKDMSRIPMILEEMAAAKIEPNTITYSAIIKGYCISPENRVNKAFELLDEMKRSTKASPDEITYNTLLDGCARFGSWDRGIATLHEMEEAGVSPSNFTLGILVKLANRSKRPDTAFQLTEQLCAKYRITLNVHVFNNLIHACTQHNNFPKGLLVLTRMLREKVRPDARTYLLLLQGAISGKCPSDAAGLLRAAGGLSGAHPAVDGYAQLAKPKESLAVDAVSEAIEGIAGVCKAQVLAMELLRDIRDVPGLPVDRRRLMRSTCKQAFR